MHYLGGIVATTRLIDASGNLINIGDADPNDTFVGVAGAFSIDHTHWGVIQNFSESLLAGGTFEPDFIQGGNAGTLNLFSSQAMVLDGGITAAAFGGLKQVQGNDLPIGGTFNLGANPAASSGQTTLAGLTQGTSTSITGESGEVILQDSAPQLSDLASGFNADTPLDTAALDALGSSDPDNLLATTVVPVDTLNSGGFANVNVTETATNGSNGIVVAAGTQLTLQPGGSIKFNSPDAAVSVLGSLVVPAGTVSISSGANIVVGPNALISVAGQWVNDDIQTASGTTFGGSEYINGGSITLSTIENSSAGSGSTSQNVTDTSGSIILQAGSVLNLSSGGELQANGQMLMQSGIAEGTAGSLSLLTYANNSTAPFGLSGDAVLPTNQPMAGRIEMDGTIDSFGFAGGGTLTLQALGFQIGGDPTQAPVWDLDLPANFFASQGFGKYVLNAMYDVTVAPGTTIALTQQNLIPNVPALLQAATGADITASGLTTLGTLDPFHRQATDLVMTAGGLSGLG